MQEEFMRGLLARMTAHWQEYKRRECRIGVGVGYADTAWLHERLEEEMGTRVQVLTRVNGSDLLVNKKYLLKGFQPLRTAQVDPGGLQAEWLESVRTKLQPIFDQTCQRIDEGDSVYDEGRRLHKELLDRGESVTPEVQNKMNHGYVTRANANRLWEDAVEETLGAAAVSDMRRTNDLCTLLGGRLRFERTGYWEYGRRKAQAQAPFTPEAIQAALGEDYDWPIDAHERVQRVDDWNPDWARSVRPEDSAEEHEGPDENILRGPFLLSTLLSHWTGRALDAEKFMSAANVIMGGHGVDSLEDENAYNGSYWGGVIGLYVNLGDTYVRTLVYDVGDNRFMFTSWGSFLEAWQEENPPEENNQD
jgi:hypothetical protein